MDRYQQAPKVDLCADISADATYKKVAMFPGLLNLTGCVVGHDRMNSSMHGNIVHFGCLE